MKSAMDAFMQAPHRLLIGGQWLDGHTGERIGVIDPSTERAIATVPAGDANDVDKAVHAALATFAPDFRAQWTPMHRARLLWALADAVESRAEQFATIESLDVGKPIKHARAIDVPGAVAALRYFSGWATKISGETMSVSMPGDWQAFTIREPVGVVGQIIPWNYPLMGAISKLAPALAAGCASVLKPAEQTPLSALYLGQVAMEVGFPPGLINIITGLGPVAGAALVAHPHVAKISFTGSTSTGEKIIHAAAPSMKRVTLELGGKSPIIVLPDADIDKAAATIARAIFLNSGQTCSVGSRLLVHREVAAPIVDAIARAARALRVGVASDVATDMGPLVSAEHRERVMAHLDRARAQGATFAAGGARRSGEGFFVEPTVLTETCRGMSVVDDEIFGPVLVVSTFAGMDLDEIAAEANATVYGLAAYVWTNNLSHAHGLVRRLKAGTVRVNSAGGGDFSIPVGGFKRSGFGRENGRIGVEAYTEVKSVTIACQ